MKPLKPTSESRARTSKPRPEKPAPAAEILDFVKARIETHPMALGDEIEVRVDRLGYSIFTSADGSPVARLRPVDQRKRFEILYWCYEKGGWRPVHGRKPTIMGLVDALEFIDDDPLCCFWL